MKWNPTQVEQFFGGKFEPTENQGMSQLRFTNKGINYILLVTQEEDCALVCLAADIKEHFPSTPLFESMFHCKRIDLAEVARVGPVLLFRASDSDDEDSVRLHVIRRNDGHFAVSPQWPGEPWRKG